MTFLVIHRNGVSEPLVVEYANRDGAEAAALHLCNTQGGFTTVFAAFELRSYWQRRDLESGAPPFGPQDDPERRAEAEQYLADAATDDVHSSDVEPRS